MATNILIASQLKKKNLSKKDNVKYLVRILARFGIIPKIDEIRNDISVGDIINGSIRLPFTSRSAWRSTQLDDPDLRRVHAYLSQGTRPSKKLTSIKEIKRYLNIVTIARDGS